MPTVVHSGSEPRQDPAAHRRIRTGDDPDRRRPLRQGERRRQATLGDRHECRVDGRLGGGAAAAIGRHESCEQPVSGQCLEGTAPPRPDVARALGNRVEVGLQGRQRFRGGPVRGG
jgi:hypothetical protein